MYQGTTPALTFQIAGFDVSEMTPFVSFRRGADVLTKTGSDVTVVYDTDNQRSVIVCKLTQAETLAMRQGDATVQMRFIDVNNEAYATSKATVGVEDVIYKEIIHYNGGGEE